MALRLRFWVGLALSACSLACTDLPTIERNECGNAVREGRESCDTFAWNAGGICRPKGSVGECHLDCRLQSDGTRGLCPEGWGCDTDGLCRKPVGTFSESVDISLSGVESLTSGDYDGDGRADLVTREPVDAVLRGKPTLHYLDPNGAVRLSLPFPKPVGEPFVGNIDGDRQDDFVFTTFQVGVMHGRSDRNWVAGTFSSYRVPKAHLRVVGAVDEGAVSGGPSVVALTTLQGSVGIFVPNDNGTLRSVAPLPAPVETLAGEIRTGNLVDGVESPCKEVVLAYRGATSFSVFDLCDLDTTIGFPVWKEQADVQTVALDPPAAIEATLIADLNGDQHLDVLLGTATGVYAAYGDGRHLPVARRYFLYTAAADFDPAIRMPLAVGEFSGDSKPDFVFPQGILSSVAGAAHPSGYPVYVTVAGTDSVPWTEAVIADLNGNGKADVVAASRYGAGIYFFNGTNGLFLAQSSIPTAGPVEHLTIGDFDGDQLADVAFMERATSASDQDSLRIAYGAPAGTPQAPLTVAQIDAAEQVSGFADAGFSSLAVASSVVRRGELTGQVATLNGGDRLPLALHSLVRLAEDGSIADSVALAISVGDFLGKARPDVVALGYAENGPSGQGFDFWLIASIDDNASVPVRLSGALPAGFAPLHEDANGSAQLALAATALDVDGDGVDESIWMMPSQDGGRCGLFWFDVDARAEAVLARGMLELPEPCGRASLKAADLDADGRSELLVQSSDAAEVTGGLWVLWNDGSGSFRDPVRISRLGEVPRAFALLRRSEASSVILAYVTASALELVGTSGEPGSPSVTGQGFFDVRTQIRQLEQGSSVTSGDFNGDGVLDLAFVDAGKVELAFSQLEPP